MSRGGRLPILVGGIFLGVVSGIYVFDGPLRAASEDVYREHGLDPSTMPRSVLSGRKEVAEIPLRGPVPQRDITYYQSDAVVQRERGRVQDGYQIFEVNKKGPSPDDKPTS